MDHGIWELLSLDACAAFRQVNGNDIAIPLRFFDSNDDRLTTAVVLVRQCIRGSLHDHRLTSSQGAVGEAMARLVDEPAVAPVSSTMRRGEGESAAEADRVPPELLRVRRRRRMTLVALDRGEPQQQQGGKPVASPDEDTRSGGLIGTWHKITTAPCADKYPAILTFSTGTYRGARGPGQGMVWWDAGIYRLEGPQRLVLSVATDELVTYEIAVRGDQFEVTDAEGCRFAYRRAPVNG